MQVTKGVCPHYIKCKSPQTFDPVSCSCACPELKSCINPVQSFNKDTCQCECPRDIDCGSPARLFNPVTCKCSCRHRPVCTSNQRFDESSCTCVCINILCTPFQKFNPYTCQCECEHPLQCGDDQTFDNTLCRCVPLCKPPRVFMSNVFSCVCPNIPNDCIFDPVKCECLSCTKDPMECGPNFTFNRTNCKCVCDLECPSPYTLDSTTCQCNCNKQCPPGQMLTSGCSCVPMTCSTAKSEEDCAKAMCDQVPTKSCM